MKPQLLTSKENHIICFSDTHNQRFENGVVGNILFFFLSYLSTHIYIGLRLQVIDNKMFREHKLVFALA